MTQKDGSMRDLSLSHSSGDCFNASDMLKEETRREEKLEVSKRLRYVQIDGDKASTHASITAIPRTCIFSIQSSITARNVGGLDGH